MAVPTITSPNTFSMDEGQTAIDTVLATDPEGNPVAFSIKLGGDGTKFRIDPATGALSFRLAPDYEVPTDADLDGIYTLKIQVKDTVTGEFTLQDITVTVDDIMPVTLNGDEFNNVIGPVGTTFEGDTLNGNDGDDTLDGGLGADTMTGGNGSDTYYVDNAADVVVEPVGDGYDKVFASVSFAMQATDGLNELELTGTADINGTGNDLVNVLIGNSGRNILDGGAGADTMTGGDDNDTYIVDNASDIVIESAGIGTGIDSVTAKVSHTLAANVENLTLTGVTGLETLSGTGNELGNVINGNNVANTLSGLGGNDTLDGKLGRDTMIGGDGSDEYNVDDSLETVTELVGEGLDTVKSTVNFTLSANVDRLFLQGTANINGSGQELANHIVGNAGINTLRGLGGTDTLDGGLGADIMIGGNGNDIYIVDALDTVTETSSTHGLDTVKAGITYSIETIAFVENLTLTGTADINATGNGLENTLVGNSGTNVLTGGAGDDTYTIQSTTDSVVEIAGEGIDLVRAAGGNGVTFVLADFVENLELTGLSSSNGTGNTLDNVITGTSANNTLSGLGGNDTLIGGIGVDTLLGGEGNDNLDGGNGNDSMTGGNGDDSYVVDSITDTVTESALGGADTVVAKVTGYTLAAEVETLQLGGSFAINGSGNGADNTIIGNGAANIISGGGGNDTMNGAGGADTIIGGSGIDLMTGGFGNDTFSFTAITDSGATTILGDQIMDYKTGDKVSLAAIDALTSTVGVNDAFVVDANGVFVAGEMKAVQTGTDVVVSLYMDNDQTADMVFTVHLGVGVAAVDFLL